MKQRNTLFASLPVTKVLARAFPKRQSLSNAGEIMDRQKFRKNRKYWSVQYLSWCYLISLVSLLNNFAATKLAQLPLVCKLFISKVICLFLKIWHHWHQSKTYISIWSTSDLITIITLSWSRSTQITAKLASEGKLHHRQKTAITV